MKERVEPMEEAAPILRKKKPGPKPSVAVKGKRIEADAQRKKKKWVPSMRPREIIIGSSATPATPKPILEEGGPILEMMITTRYLLVCRELGLLRKRSLL